MAKGNTALLDALGAFLVSIALIAVVSIGTGRPDIGARAVERESLRQEIYRIISSGNATTLLNRCFDEGTVETGSVLLTLHKPIGDTTFITFFMSRDGGTTTFYITKKE
ncbi:MAG: hypothetical protein QFX35_04125 [Candidatus Verstraetearchaeota archaeon]|nr:hypothetical protein [Candidatus Verstraetearchaeota archaeon]